MYKSKCYSTWDSYWPINVVWNKWSTEQTGKSCQVGFTSVKKNKTLSKHWTLLRTEEACEVNNVNTSVKLNCKWKGAQLSFFLQTWNGFKYIHTIILCFFTDRVYASSNQHPNHESYLHTGQRHFERWSCDYKVITWFALPSMRWQAPIWFNCTIWLIQ